LPLRFPLLIFCCLSVLILSAQQTKPSQKHREWSLTIAPQFNKRVKPKSIGVLEADFVQSSSLSFVLMDTFLINGVEQVYFDEFSTGEKVKGKPSSSNTWFGVGVAYHLRAKKGQDLAAGVYFSQGKRGVLVEDFSGNQPDDFHYRSFEQRNIKGGFTVRLNQHIWRAKRLHPYLGANLFLLIDRSITDGNTFDVLPLHDLVIPSGSIVERFRSNTIFDFDLSLNLGLLYQLSKTWAVGVEVDSHGDQFAGPFRLQLRKRIQSTKKALPNG
jgi:hypothetical protein